MVQLDLQSRVPIYEQLVAKISELILLGVLNPDTQLPTVRKLASQLKINPNTVQKAYQELERQGIIYALPGKGSFVAAGERSAAILRDVGLDKLKKALVEAQRIGLSRKAAMDLIDEVYGGIQHD